jgi:alpha-tubulin suppressor-like RCC1 family protein
MRTFNKCLLVGCLPLVLAFFALLTCSNRSGTTSVVVGESATIYEVEGIRPAPGVVVKIFDARSEDNRPVLVCITDSRGMFSIKELPEGAYNVFAEKDSFVLLQDSVSITPRGGNLRNDTLEYPSTLFGVVGVEPVHDPNTVTIAVAGTGKNIEVSNDDGTFILTGIPSGKCVLRLASRLPGYIETVKEVVVTPRSKDTLNDTLRVIYSGIPFISGVRLSQDVLTGTIRVTWNKVQCVDFKDYVVYDDPCTSITLLPEPSHSSTDTFLIDSMFSQLYASQSDTFPRCLKYRVAVRTLAQQVGLTTGYTEFQFMPKGFIWTFFDKKVLYEGRPFDSVSIDDTVVFSFTAKNRTRPLRKVVWFDPQKGYIAGHIRDSTKREVSDSLRYAFHGVGNHELRVIVTDSAGNDWWDYVMVKTVIDTLIAFAGGDTGVFVGENVHLHGGAYHLFGTIPYWRWKIGDNDWVRTSGHDTVVPMPLTERQVECCLWITDEDGTSKKDTMNVFTSLKAVKIASGDYHSLVLKSDGALWTFGRNEFGQLCDGNKEHRTWPVPVMSDVTDMAAGSYHTLILKKDKTLWACGNNSNGQFGDGTTEGRLVPKKVMNDVKNIAAGSFFSLILKTDATLWVCGDLQSGQIPGNSISDRCMPVLLMNDVQSMAAGFDFILALKNDGTLWTCGNNTYGQLCDSSTGSRFIPQQVMSGVKSIGAGHWHSLILKYDGTLWTSGYNSDGELGRVSSFAYKTPQQIASSVRSVAAGAFHSLIVKTDGTLWACGRNSSGQLGDGTEQPRGVPTYILGDVQNVTAGYEHSLLLKTDGTVWACGKSDYGQLGVVPLSAKTFLRTVPYHYYP